MPGYVIFVFTSKLMSTFQRTVKTQNNRNTQRYSNHSENAIGKQKKKDQEYSVKLFQSTPQK